MISEVDGRGSVYTASWRVEELVLRAIPALALVNMRGVQIQFAIFASLVYFVSAQLTPWDNQVCFAYTPLSSVRSHSLFSALSCSILDGAFDLNGRRSVY